MDLSKSPYEVTEKTPNSSNTVDFSKNLAGIDINMKDCEDDGRITQLVEEYKDVFSNGCLNTTDTEPMVIKLKENDVPKSITRLRKVSMRDMMNRSKRSIRWKPMELLSI